jgi:long-chain acyl-CoA synthetase
LRSAIHSVFEAAKAVKPGKPLLVASSGTLTYGALVERAGRIAALLKKNGISPGDRAIVSSADDIEAVAAFLGCLRSGVAAVMLDSGLPEREARALVSAARAGCAFVDPDKRGWVDRVPHVFGLGKAATKAGMLGRLLKKGADEFPAFLEGIEPVDPPQEIDDGLDAYIMFTSGTTSRPKGVRISHRALFSHLATLSRQFGIDEGSRILNVLPLSHADGLIQGPVSALYNRVTVYRPFDFSLQRLTDLLDAVYRERITHFIAVPSILAIINRLGHGHEDSFATGDLKDVISTAGYLEKGLWEGFEKKFGVRVSNVYGLTETVAGGLFSGPLNADHRVGTVGRPVDCEALIVSEDGSSAPIGVPGELLLRGSNIMTGYFDDDEATAEALRGGWLHTGDIALRDQDGFFTIAGRKKNIIVSGGLNIQPEEVTEVLVEHPGVAEAVTFGVEDPVFGEAVVSCVALAPGSSAGQAELAQWCRVRLAHYKVPQRVHIFPELPKGRSGKVIVEEAKGMAIEANGAEKKADGGLRERVLSAAAETFRTSASELSEFSTPADVAGWDSLAHLQFVVALEEAFGVRLDPADIIRIDSIGEAERIVRGKLPA